MIRLKELILMTLLVSSHAGDTRISYSYQLPEVATYYTARVPINTILPYVVQPFPSTTYSNPAQLPAPTVAHGVTYPNPKPAPLISPPYPAVVRIAPRTLSRAFINPLATTRVLYSTQAPRTVPLANPHASAVYTGVAEKQTTEEYPSDESYSFGYDIHDSLTGDSKRHYERRENGVVTGSYSVVEADGSVRTVDYTADPEHGFNAVVRKEAIASITPLPPPTVSVTPATVVEANR